MDTSSKDAITLCINKGCAVIMSDTLLMKKKMSIKSHFGGKKHPDELLVCVRRLPYVLCEAAFLNLVLWKHMRL